MDAAGEQRHHADRARSALAAAARASGTATPSLETPETGTSCRALLRDGTPTVVIPRSRIAVASDDALLGVAAHEVAHLVHEDAVDPASDSDMLSPVWVLTLLSGAFLVGVALAVVVATVVGIDAFYTIGTGGLLGLGLCLLGLRTVRLRWLRGHYGVDAPIVELRADLAAARAVGRRPIEAFLSELPDHRGVRWQGWLAGTHPRAELRLAAVRSDDGLTPVLEHAVEAWRYRRDHR